MLYTLPLIAQAVLASTAAQGLLRQHDDSDPTSLPGGSPLTFCNDSRATDLFFVHQIELYPNPLHIDDIFEVHLYGTFLEALTTDASWTYFARYSNSTEHESGTMDFCKSLDSIDQPTRQHRTHGCPPEAGPALVMMSAWVMPMFIVPGDYYFKFDAVTKEGARIYCLDAHLYLDYKHEDQEQHPSQTSGVSQSGHAGKGE
ncbi:MAG: hypothetical protein FRX48_01453 [Lasallia pustulata]|uniref:MD-2-related lipid-recognition domain-containing protein n=1 Tax=Lasallia pustulata TaxID=136370 RepID=A0A5M8PYA7_9LECA|nr:MAG: hypothetical protein FRX48_01453 [Lasallia pustulata]